MVASVSGSGCAPHPSPEPIDGAGITHTRADETPSDRPEHRHDPGNSVVDTRPAACDPVRVSPTPRRGPPRAPAAPPPAPRVHAHRVAGGARHHRRPGRLTPPGRPEGAG